MLDVADLIHAYLARARTVHLSPATASRLLRRSHRSALPLHNTGGRNELTVRLALHEAATRFDPVSMSITRSTPDAEPRSLTKPICQADSIATQAL